SARARRWLPLNSSRDHLRLACKDGLRDTSPSCAGSCRMVRVSLCAIIAANYLPYARVLADSFFTHHPDGSLTVLVVDDEDRRVVPDDPRIDWWRLADLGLTRREIHRLAGIYDVTELSTAVKPLFLRRLLDEGHREVVFLDPDIRVFAPLDEVIPLARRHGIVLTPHTTAPYPRDGRQIDGRFV